jgi:predicted kinase
MVRVYRVGCASRPTDDFVSHDLDEALDAVWARLDDLRKDLRDPSTNELDVTSLNDKLFGRLVLTVELWERNEYITARPDLSKEALTLLESGPPRLAERTSWDHLGRD